MTRTFVELSVFTKRWNELGLDDDDLRLLQIAISENPQIGDVIKGTGGIRKVRFAIDNKGKSGGGRAIYVDFALYNKVYLLTAYPKSEQIDLTEAQRRNLGNIVSLIKKSLEQE